MTCRPRRARALVGRSSGSAFPEGSTAGASRPHQRPHDTHEPVRSTFGHAAVRDPDIGDRDVRDPAAGTRRSGPGPSHDHAHSSMPPDRGQGPLAGGGGRSSISKEGLLHHGRVARSRVTGRPVVAAVRIVPSLAEPKGRRRDRTGSRRARRPASRVASRGALRVRRTDAPRVLPAQRRCPTPRRRRGGVHHLASDGTRPFTVSGFARRPHAARPRRRNAPPPSAISAIKPPAPGIGVAPAPIDWFRFDSYAAERISKSLSVEFQITSR